MSASTLTYTLRYTNIVILLACSLSAWACRQAAQENAAALAISEVYVAKDDGGKAGARAAVIPATDNTFHCIVELNKKEAGAKLTATLIAVEAEGGFENYEVRSLEVITDSTQQHVAFPFSLARPWQKGSYRCDVQLNEQTTTSINFSIQ